MPPPPPVDISVLIPCLNEAENISGIVNSVRAELAKAEVTYEIIFIDNGSTDNTVGLIKQHCAHDNRVRLIVNNKNYGQLRSPTYGIYQTSGRAVIGISADFQDPVELIGEFIARWKAGAPIVLGVRRSEKTSIMLRLVRAAGYGFFERFGDYRVIPGATGFGLYDRKVVDCLKRWRDPEPFFRGMLVESGFHIETIPYHRPERASGKSKNNLLTILDLGISGLASSSKGLLRLPFYISLVIFVVSGVTIIAAIGDMILTDHFQWSLLILVAVQLGFALLFMFLGLIGEQVRLIAEMSRRVPLVIEKERINFPTHET